MPVTAAHWIATDLNIQVPCEPESTNRTVFNPSRLVMFPGFFAGEGGGGGKEGRVSPTAKRGPADDLNVRHALYY